MRPLDAYLGFVASASIALRKSILESAEGNKATIVFLGWYCLTDIDKRLDSCLYHCVNRDCLSKLLISMVKTATKESRESAADVVKKISQHAPGTFAHVLAGDNDFFNAYGGLEAGQELYDKMRNIRGGSEQKAAVPLPFRPATIVVAAVAADNNNNKSNDNDVNGGGASSEMTKSNSNGGTCATTTGAKSSSVSNCVGSGTSMLAKTLKFNTSSINGTTATVHPLVVPSANNINASKSNPLRAHNNGNNINTMNNSTNNASTKVVAANHPAAPRPSNAPPALAVPVPRSSQCSIANIFATSSSNNFNYHYNSPLPLIGTRRYDRLATILSATSFPDRSIAPTVGLSSDITDEKDQLFQFVASKFRPTDKTLKNLKNNNSEYKFPHTVTRIRMINSDRLVQQFLLSHEKDREAMQDNPTIRAAALAGGQLTDKASAKAMKALRSFYEDDDDALLHEKSRIVFGWHGTSCERVDGICRHGFFNGIRTTDSGFFGSGLYFSMEADYATRYSIAEEFKNDRGEYVVILSAVSVSRTYPITLERDYRSEEHENQKELWGMSRFVLCNGTGKTATEGGSPSMAIQSPFDSHFIPVKKYAVDKHPRGEFYVVDNSGKKELAKKFVGDVDFQAADADDPELAGHELVIARDTNAIPIAIVYFKEHGL